MINFVPSYTSVVSLINFFSRNFFDNIISQVWHCDFAAVSYLVFWRIYWNFLLMLKRENFDDNKICCNKVVRFSRRFLVSFRRLSKVVQGLSDFLLRLPNIVEDIWGISQVFRLYVNIVNLVQYGIMIQRNGLDHAISSFFTAKLGMREILAVY